VNALSNPNIKSGNYLNNISSAINGYDTSIYNYLPYKIRQPYDTESEYFKNNPNVAGMKTEDKKIILNQYSKLSPEQLEIVKYNEALRLYLDDLGITPNITITPEQKQYFQGTPYYNDEKAMKNTIIARILTNDPSSQSVTRDQQDFADAVYKKIMQGNNNFMISNPK
jgi:hypothetical protein